MLSSLLLITRTRIEIGMQFFGNPVNVEHASGDLRPLSPKSNIKVQSSVHRDVVMLKQVWASKSPFTFKRFKPWCTNLGMIMHGCDGQVSTYISLQE